MVAAQGIVFMLGLVVVLHDWRPSRQYFGSGVMPVQVGHVQTITSPMEPLVLLVPYLGQGPVVAAPHVRLVHFGGLQSGHEPVRSLRPGRLVERMYARCGSWFVRAQRPGRGVAAALLSPINAATADRPGAVRDDWRIRRFVLLNRRHWAATYMTAAQWLGNTLVLLILFSMLPGVSWQDTWAGLWPDSSRCAVDYHRFGTAEQRGRPCWAGVVADCRAGAAFERGLLHEPRPPEPGQVGVGRPPIVDEWTDFRFQVWATTEGRLGGTR